MRRLMLLALICGMLGCSSVKLRVGPLGSGIATPTTGPGVEAAVSGSDGETIASTRIAFSPQGALLEAWQWIRGLLPGGTLALFSDAETPTGPEE